MAKRRQMPSGEVSATTPAGLAAASMLMNAGDNTYADLDQGMIASTARAAVNASKLEQLPAMVQGVMGNDPAVQTECTTQFRRLLSIEKNPPIQQVIDAQVVPRFVEFLQRDDNPALQFEAAWALTNIASGTSEHTKVVMEVGAVPIFVRLLMSPNDDVREQAVWALGNIAGDSPPCRDLVLQAGAMQPLLMQLHQNSKLSMLRNATWTLSNFCRGKPQPDFEMVRPALPTLAQLIFSPDEEVLTDACWALSYLSDGPNEKIQAVIESGIIRRLVELLLNPRYVIFCYPSLSYWYPDLTSAVLALLSRPLPFEQLETLSPVTICRHNTLSTTIRSLVCWRFSLAPRKVSARKHAGLFRISQLETRSKSNLSSRTISSHHSFSFSAMPSSTSGRKLLGQSPTLLPEVVLNRSSSLFNKVAFVRSAIY